MKVDRVGKKSGLLAVLDTQRPRNQLDHAAVYAEANEKDVTYRETTWVVMLGNGLASAPAVQKWLV